jgi:hypothetical protein
MILERRPSPGSCDAYVLSIWALVELQDVEEMVSGQRLKRNPFFNAIEVF